MPPITPGRDGSLNASEWFNNFNCNKMSVSINLGHPEGKELARRLAALGVPQNILTESTLSFLGFGIQPPDSSWGLMLSQGRQYIVSAWWVVVCPGMAIFLTALSFNLFGVWMRAVSDPLQRWRWLKPTKEAREAGIST